MPQTEIPAEPTQATPARAPRRSYTAEEIKDLAEALALPEVQNNINAAAAVLAKKYPQHTYMRWYKMSKSNDYLRAMHPATKPEDVALTESEGLDRTPLLSQDEVEENKALLRQEATLASGEWEKLGISPERAQRMISLERFARLPLQHSVLATHGGVLKCFEGLSAVYDKYLGLLFEGKLPQEFDKEGAPKDTQRDWLYALVSTSAEIRQIKATIDRSNLLMLKSEQLARELKRGKDGPGRKGKFGASPLLAIKAEAGAHVTINEQK